MRRSGLTGTVTVRISANGTSEANGTWRVDDFTLTGSVGGGGTDNVSSSVDFTLAIGVEQLSLTGSQALHGSGNESANVIVGNDAANLLDGAGGADRVSGGGGDDVLVHDGLDTLLDGGSGSDTLRVDGNGVVLDLRAIADDILLHFEHIDVGGSGNNSLQLNVSDVLAMGADGNVLHIGGDAGDAVVSTAQGWLADGGAPRSSSAASRTSVPSAGAAHLLIDIDLLPTSTLS